MALIVYCEFVPQLIDHDAAGSWNLGYRATSHRRFLRPHFLRGGAERDVAWTLLGACRIHQDVERAERAASQIRSKKGTAEYASSRVLLSNIFAPSRKWEANSFFCVDILKQIGLGLRQPPSPTECVDYTAVMLDVWFHPMSFFHCGHNMQRLIYESSVAARVKKDI